MIEIKLKNLYFSNHSLTVLGADITVPTIDDDVRYSISEGTQNGTVFRLKGKGIKKVNRPERGNQYVKIYVEVPKNLSKKQKDLLRAFEASLTDRQELLKETELLREDKGKIRLLTRCGRTKGAS